MQQCSGVWGYLYFEHHLTRLLVESSSWNRLQNFGFKKNNKMLYCLHLPCSQKQVEWVVLYKKVVGESLLKWFVCRLWLVPSAAADTAAGGGGRSQCNHIKNCWSLGVWHRPTGSTILHSAQTILIFVLEMGKR